MEQKKAPRALDDGELEQVAGGGSGTVAFVTCPLCKCWGIKILAAGATQTTCPDCGATLYCINGEVITAVPSTDPDWDTDDSWL